MQVSFPVLQWWLRCFTSHILPNVLRGPSLSPFCVQDVAVLVKLNNIGENSERLLKGARLLKNAGIVYAFK